MIEKIRIGSRLIGPGEPSFVIAEAGSNHDGQWKQATQLIEAASDAGADAVKFQVYAAEDLYPPGTDAFEQAKATELPREWIPKLSEFSERQGLEFLASAFSEEAIDRLAEVDVPAYKWASSETVNLPLLKYAAAKHRPILLSTGMSDLADVHEAIEVIRSEGNEDIVLLQCTSVYPTDPQLVHLRAMDTLRLAFHRPVGFSDHTTDTVIPAAAVARGACVVEKTLTVNRTLPGPDHAYALEPVDFASMVDGIRATELALGSPEKTLLPQEAELARRSSIRAARDIEAGEVITRDLVVVEPPAQGIRPRLLAAILGRQARERIPEGAAITWDAI